MRYWPVHLLEAKSILFRYLDFIVVWSDRYTTLGKMHLWIYIDFIRLAVYNSIWCKNIGCSMEWMTIQDVATKWGVSVRGIHVLCTKE